METATTRIHFMFAFLSKFCIIIRYDSNSSKKKWKALVVLVTFGKLLFISFFAVNYC